MTVLNLDNAICYDVESFPNVFTLDMEFLHTDTRATWEISQFRDDRKELMTWFNWTRQTQTPMIGFFSLGYDYLVIHYIFNNPHATPEMIYAVADNLIGASKDERYKHTVWADKRIASQIHFAEIQHLDNP